jgi:hypothetical protein
MPGTLNFAKNANLEDVATHIEAIGNWSVNGLEALFLMTGSLARATRNLAPGKPDGVFSQTLPVTGANYLRFISSTSWMDTQIPDLPEQTVLGVYKYSAAADAAVLASTYKSTAAPSAHGVVSGTTVYSQRNGSNLTVNAQYWNGAALDLVGANLFHATVGSFALGIARIGVGGIKLNNMTAGTTATAATASTRDVNGLNIRIGSGQHADLAGGTIDIAAIAIFSRQLADGELTPLYTQIKNNLAAHAITV